MKKRLLSLALVSTLIFLFAGTAKAESLVEVVVDKQSVNLQHPIVVEKGFTLLPLRFFSETLDAKVEYLPTTGTAIITKGDNKIKIVEPTGRVFINDKEQQLNAPIKNIKGRLYVPLRFLGTALGCQIDWQDQNNRVVVKTDKYQEQSRIIWEKQFDRKIIAKPLPTTDGKIYIPNGHVLTALDIQGNTLWSLSLGKHNEIDLTEQILGTPILQKNTLYLTTSDYQESSSKFIRTLFSVSTDGKLNWSLEHQSRYKGETANIPGRPSFSTKNNRLYYRDKEGVIAYIPEPQQHWRYNSDFELPIDPIIVNRNEQSDDLVVVDRAIQGQVIVLNQDAQEEWRFPIQLGRVSDMVYDGSSRRLFVALEETSSAGGSGILCLDLLNRAWQYQNYFTESKINKMQAIKDELYVATNKGFYKLDRHGNIKKFNPEYEGIVDFNISVEGNILALYSNGLLRQYEDGMTSWEFVIKNAHALTVAPTGNVLVSTKDNKIFYVNTNRKI